MENIRFAYRARGSRSTVTFELSPEDYYDPLEPGDESYEQDGIARHLEPHRYVPVEPDDLEFLVVSVPTANGCREFREQFLDGLRSFCVHSLWADGTEELIHSTEIAQGRCHITRTRRDTNGYWSVTTNTLIDEDENDTEMFDFLGGRSWKSLVEFWSAFASERESLDVLPTDSA